MPSQPEASPVLPKGTLGDGAALQNSAQAFALQQLRDNKWCAALFSDVVNGKNVGVIERRDCLRLLFKAPQPVAFPGEGFRKNFQSNFASKACIARAIYFAHSAGSDGGENFVGTKSCARS